MLDIDLVGDGGTTGLDADKEEILSCGDPKDTRWSLFESEKEEMLDIDVAGDDGAVGLGMEKEEALDVALLRAPCGAMSNAGKVKSRNEDPRDLRRVSLSNTGFDCVLESSEMLESLSGAPEPLSNINCEMSSDCACDCACSVCIKSFSSPGPIPEEDRSAVLYYIVLKNEKETNHLHD